MPEQRYEPFGVEIKRFLARFDSHSFQALDRGFGYARVQRPDEAGDDGEMFQGDASYEEVAANLVEPLGDSTTHGDKGGDAVQPPLVQETPVDIMQQWKQTPEAKLEDASAPSVATPLRPEPAPVQRVVAQGRPGIALRFLKLVFAHCIDLVTVGASLSVAIVCAGMAFAPRTKPSLASSIGDWMPVKLFMGLGLLEFLAAIYLLFLIYNIFFRLFVGSTLGHAVVGLISRKPSTRGL